MIKANFPKRAVAMWSQIYSFDVYEEHTEKELLSMAGFKGGMLPQAWIVPEVTVDHPHCRNCQAERYAGISIEQINLNHRGEGEREYTPEQERLYREWWHKQKMIS